MITIPHDIYDNVFFIEEANKEIDCPNCEGGEATLKDGNQYTCPACDGKGEITLFGDRWPRICPECEGNGRTETKLVTNIHEDTIILVLADCTGIFYHRQYGYDINRHDPESRFFSTREEAEKYLEEEGNK